MQQVKPGKWMYGLAAGIFFIGGIACFVLWTVGTRNNLRHQQALQEDLVRIPISTEGQVVRLPEGENLVFIEHDRGDGAEELVDVQVASATTGDEVTQLEPSIPSSYSSDARVGDVYSALVVEGREEYRVTATYLGDETDAKPLVTVGPWSSNGSAILLIAVGMGGLALCLIAGIVLGLVAFFMRRSGRKAIAQPSGAFLG